MSRRLETPLFPLYEKYGARTIVYDNWIVAVAFSGLAAEGEAFRRQACLFDFTYWGCIEISGADTGALLQHLTTKDVANLPEGQIQLQLMCYSDGGLVDRILLCRAEPDRFLLIPSPGNAAKDVGWLTKQQEGGVLIRDLSRKSALIGLYGPEAEAILQRITEIPLRALAPLSMLEGVAVGDVTATILRVPFAGQDGFGLLVPEGEAIDLWEHLLHVGCAPIGGILPAGVLAAERLRFAASVPAYGRELSASASPLEAGLDAFVDSTKAEFIGRAELARQRAEGPLHRLVRLELSHPARSRPDDGVYADKRRVGRITTGGRGCALAYVERPWAIPGRTLWVEARGAVHPAKVVSLPYSE